VSIRDFLQGGLLPCAWLLMSLQTDKETQLKTIELESEKLLYP